MEEYRSNSHKSREGNIEQPTVREKKVEKVVSGTVKTRKKSGLQKFASIFVPEDVEDVKGYIIEDIVVPAVKDIILDAVRVVLGVEKRSSSRNSTSRASYRKYYDDRDRRDSREPRGVRTSIDFDDIILDTRAEAENVLQQMDDLIATYQLVSIADLHDLVGESSNYTDNKYGWTNIRTASVVRVRDGYMIKLPKALPLD